MPAANSGLRSRGGSPAKPSITAAGGGVVIGAGFLPHHAVTVRMTRPGEDISDYLAYVADGDGDLRADLPAPALIGPLRVAATDHRPDPDGRCGLLWSNTCCILSS